MSASTVAFIAGLSLDDAAALLAAHGGNAASALDAHYFAAARDDGGPATGSSTQASSAADTPATMPADSAADAVTGEGLRKEQATAADRVTTFTGLSGTAAAAVHDGDEAQPIDAHFTSAADRVAAVTGLTPPEMAALLAAHGADEARAVDAHFAIASSTTGPETAAGRVAAVTGLSVSAAAALLIVHGGDEAEAADAHLSGRGAPSFGLEASWGCAVRGTGAKAGRKRRFPAEEFEDDMENEEDEYYDEGSGGDYGGRSYGHGSRKGKVVVPVARDPALLRAVTHSGWPRRPPTEDLAEIDKLNE